MQTLPQGHKKITAHEKYLLAVFGDAEAKAIKPEHVRRYMDARGKKAVFRLITSIVQCLVYTAGGISVVMYQVIRVLVSISFLNPSATAT